MKLLVLQVMKKCLQCLVSLHQTWHQDKLNGILLNTSLSHWSTSPREQSGGKKKESACRWRNWSSTATNWFVFVRAVWAARFILDTCIKPLTQSIPESYRKEYKQCIQSKFNYSYLQEKLPYAYTYYSQHRHIMQWKAKLQLTGNWAPKVNDSCSIYGELCIILTCSIALVRKVKKKAPA